MARPIRLANAPCSWGVDFADRPENPDWRKVMDETAEAGFSAIDLGPVGYFPTDPSRLEDELGARKLSLSAGGLFDPFWDPRVHAAIYDKTRRTCQILKALKAPRLVIIDQVSRERGATAGRSTVARRLDREEWNKMMAAIATVAQIARDEFGVHSYLHPHAGCYIEFEDEIAQAMNDLPPELVGLCVDTGHAAYAGIDAMSLIGRYKSRTGHIHFKDIDRTVHAAIVKDGVSFFAAITRQVFCSLGQGVVDFVAVRDALESIGYTGLAVVEQDVDPTAAATPLENARRSFNYLRSVGIAWSKTPLP